MVNVNIQWSGVLIMENGPFVHMLFKRARSSSWLAPLAQMFIFEAIPKVDVEIACDHIQI